MNVFLNDQLLNVEEDTNIDELLSFQFLSENKGFAIAVNDNFVPKSKWKSYVLSEGDNILLIRATQGG
ncbi:MAG: sulfur carrier protein ThiS [Hyphomicrobiales bacterium]